MKTILLAVGLLSLTVPAHAEKTKHTHETTIKWDHKDRVWGPMLLYGVELSMQQNHGKVKTDRICYPHGQPPHCNNIIWFKLPDKTDAMLITSYNVKEKLLYRMYCHFNYAADTRICFDVDTNETEMAMKDYTGEWIEIGNGGF